MGGGGSFYDRDVTSSGLRTTAGYSSIAEEKMSRSSVNAAALPKNRRLSSRCKSPLVYALDETGSMKDLPIVNWDKWPMVAGQLQMQKYLKGPMISLAVFGDVVSDQAPLQICDFTSPRSLDDSLQRLWLEGSGGGQQVESYEFVAYFYARCYDMIGAEEPVFIFTGDEGFRARLSGVELREHFGGEHEDVSAVTIFEELKKKFQDSVVLIHPTFTLNYGREADAKIIEQWQKVLGKEQVILLESKLAIADVTLGIIALASGSRALDEYLDDIRNRPLEMAGQKYEPQSEERIAEVRRSLELFASTRKSTTSARQKPSKPTPEVKPDSEPAEEDDTEDEVGRI